MKNLILSLALAATASMAQAGLIVVEDIGGTPAAPYFEAIGLLPDEPVREPRTPMIEAVTEAFALPVRSTRLTPGRIEPRSLNAPGLLPFFLIGDDDLSRQWLKERGRILREIGAFGLVVNVESLEALQRLRDLVPGLMLSPVSGDDLAGRLQLFHYPVLITSSGIEQ